MNSASRKLPTKPVTLPIAEVTVCETEPNSGRIWLIRLPQATCCGWTVAWQLLAAAGSRSSGDGAVQQEALRRSHQIGHVDLHAQHVQDGILRSQGLQADDQLVVALLEAVDQVVDAADQRRREDQHPQHEDDDQAGVEQDDRNRVGDRRAPRQ